MRERRARRVRRAGRGNGLAARPAPRPVPTRPRIRFAVSLQLLRATGPLSVRRVEVGGVEVAQDDQEIIARVAALDIGKAEVVCCVRVPGSGPRARRMQEVRTYTTMTRSLLAMADWLAGLGVTRVVMEATGDYWRPPFYLLENTFRDVAGERQGRQAPARDDPKRIGWTLCGCARSPNGRCCGRQFRAAAGVPGAAGSDPVPGGPDHRPDGGEAAGGEAAGGRADQGVGRGQRHLRGVRAGR